MRHRPRLVALAVALLATALLGADYVLPTPDGGGPDPSPPSLTGVLESASSHQLLIAAEGTRRATTVALTPQTEIFTIYGGIVSVGELVLGAPVEVWFTPETHSKKLLPPVAAVVRVERGSE